MGVFPANNVSILFHDVTLLNLIEDLSVVGTVPTELGFLGHLEVLDFCTSKFSLYAVVGWDTMLTSSICSTHRLFAIIFSFLFP